MPLQLDTTGESGLFSLSVDLQPLRKADEVATLLLALRRYPAGLPKHLEKIAADLGGEYTVEQLTGLFERLDANSPAFLQLSSSLPHDGNTIYLIPSVDRCVACPEAPLLVVSRLDHVSRPVVITEAGARDGVLHPKLCRSCGALHFMSYAEGGMEIPAGKQLPYAKATSPENRFVQLQKGYVFEYSILKGYEAQALFSHTGYVTWAHEYRWKTRCERLSAEMLRRALVNTWLSWSLLLCSRLSLQHSVFSPLGSRTLGTHTLAPLETRNELIQKTCSDTLRKYEVWSMRRSGKVRSRTTPSSAPTAILGSALL